MHVNVRAGFYIFAVANIAMGMINLAWHDFDPFHQPVQSLGENIPGREIYACLAGALLVAGGLMMFFGRTARYGALMLAAVNLVVAIFWLPRLYTAPHFLGFTAPVIVGVLGGFCRQLVIVTGALLAYQCGAIGDCDPSGGAVTTARWIIGLSSIDFGANHLEGVRDNLVYVPQWMPFGQQFWVIFTGVAFVLAGVAILARRFDGVAAWLLGAMLLVFSAVTLLPGLVADPRILGSWGGNAHEFVLTGAVWIFAECLVAHRTPTLSMT